MPFLRKLYPFAQFMGIVDFLRELTYICLFIVGLMVVGLLSAKKKTVYNYLIIALYATMGFVLLASWNTLPNLSYLYPSLALVDMFPVYCIGPVFYHLFLYFQSRKISWKNYLHFVPAVVALLVTLPFYLQPAELKQGQVYRVFVQGQTTAPDAAYGLGLLINLAYLGVLIYRFRHLLTFPMLKAEPNLRIIAFIISNAVLSVVVAALTIITKDYIYFRLGATFVAFGLITYFILNYRNPQLVRAITLFAKNPANLRPAPDKIKPAWIIQLDKTLPELMEDKKAYRDNNLSLAVLADQAGVSIHTMSTYLNQKPGRNFYQYINSFRLAEAKKLLLESQASSIEIAHQTGFNSKATFNRTFKNETGMTPSEFRKEGKV